MAITSFTGGKYQLSDGEPFYWFIMYIISIYFFSCTFTSSKGRWNIFENYNQICEKKIKMIHIHKRHTCCNTYALLFLTWGCFMFKPKLFIRFGFGIIALHTNVTYMYMNRQLLPLNVRSFMRSIYILKDPHHIFSLFIFYILFLFCIQTFTVACMFQFFCKYVYVK